MSEPNCVITLYFYEGNAALAAPARFVYICTASSRSWNVLPDGSIYPPSKKRTVTIYLNYSPENLPDVASFSGFRIREARQSYEPYDSKPWTPTDHLPHGVSITTPDSYPPTGGKTLGPLTLDFGGASVRLSYSLAVTVGDGSPSWDDPKIYDDGSM